jgi:hypothetical protein
VISRQKLVEKWACQQLKGKENPPQNLWPGRSLLREDDLYGLLIAGKSREKHCGPFLCIVTLCSDRTGEGLHMPEEGLSAGIDKATQVPVGGHNHQATFDRAD